MDESLFIDKLNSLIEQTREGGRVVEYRDDFPAFESAEPDERELHDRRIDQLFDAIVTLYEVVNAEQRESIRKALSDEFCVNCFYYAWRSAIRMNTV